MKSLFARVRSLWQGVRRGAALDEEMEEEMGLHLELRTQDLIRSGLAPAEAARRARLEFGSPERYREEGRVSRGLRPFDQIRFSWLDVKLGGRMLMKHPGVTVVGGLAMAIGVGLGAGYLEIINDFLRPTLPLDEGERIVGIQNWDVAENDPELRSIHDFVVWREELESVQDLGAFRTIERSLGVGDGPAEPARGAEITPSAFRMARVPALLGRTLLDADEEEGAPPVVVLGYRLWRNRFAGDPGLVGRTVRLGSTTSTVVGVMPEGFAFPVSHQFWVPLQVDALAYGPREGPPIQIFGRLAPGVGREAAQAELDALGLRAAADLPATHERLRPRVVKYTELFLDAVAPSGERSAAYLVQFVFVVLLLILSSNVATMLFARTATRESEVAMRFALGASRGRILAQFFVEALVLALAATAVGLAVVAWGAKWVTRFLWEVTGGQAPFWLDGRLNSTTVLYAVVLAVLGSVVAGVMPALKATRSRVQSRLRHSPGGGGSALRFGGLWSGMIVVQVAFAVLILPPAVVAVSALAEPGYVEPGFAAEEFLSARLAMELGQPPTDSVAGAEFFSEFQAAYQELERRLLARPEVSRVTFATRLPVMDHPQPWMELDSVGRPPGAPADHWVMATSVEPDFFEAFGAEIVAGRGFDSGDLRPGPGVVVVNEHFVEEMLQGRNAIGRRVRYTTRYGQRAATGRPLGQADAQMHEPGQWYEIVGVVSGLGMDTNKDPFYPGKGPGVYHPLTPPAMGSGGSYAVRVALHVPGGAASFAPEFREIAHTVHPALRLSDVLPLDGPVDSDNRGERLISRFASWGTALVALIALLISTAGVYSVLSFTVSRQTREIGIRIALGADRRRIVTGVFSRAMAQIGIGLLAGYLIWIYLLVDEFVDGDAGGLALTLLTTSVVLTLVGLFACGVPVRRALRIEPTEALRDVA